MKLVASLLLLLALLAVAVVQYRAGTRERAAEAAYPPLGQFVEVEGLRIHALVTGPEDGSVPDLVLIHGSSGNLRDFTFSFIDRVKDRYRVIALDRPGMGHSDALPRGTEGIHDQARVLQKAAAALGAARPIVLGQSYGGAVALAWGVDAPDTLAALVTLGGPSHPWNTPLEPYYKLTSHPLGQLLVVPIITAIYTQNQVDEALEEVFAPQPVPPGYAEGFGVPLTLTRDRIRVNARHRALIAGEIDALHLRYAEIAVPLEVIHGEADRIVYLEVHGPRMVADTDQARLTPLPEIGHMVHHVAPEAAIAGIARAAERAGL
jgi:pimeloyl-ACP methyl ester carboxylesterase